MDYTDRMLLIANGRKPNAAGFISTIDSFLKKKKIITDAFFIDEYNVGEVKKNRYGLIVSLGGDGTILRVIKDFHDLGIPFFGINNGHLGFITPYTKSDWKEGLNEFLKGNCSFSDRVLLDVTHKRKSKIVKRDVAVNEVYLHRPDFRSVVKIKASVNGEVFCDPLSADGVIMATPTGSTGYSMAAGASVLANDMKAFLFMPNNPFMSMDRALVFSGDSEVTVSMKKEQKTDEGIIDIDGRFSENFTRNDTLTVSLLKETAKLVKNPALSEYERIGEKMQWKKTDVG